MKPRAMYVEDPWPLTSDEELLPEPISYDPETDDEEEEDEEKAAYQAAFFITDFMRATTNG